MPRRNVLIILGTLAASLVCHERAAQNRFAMTISTAMDIVSARYIDEVDSQVLFEGAMDGMVRKLDAYSGYTSPDEFSHFQQQLDGELTGVGIVIDSDTDTSGLKVVESLVGKPAYLAGIRPGDTIIAIDGQATQGLSRQASIAKIRGPRGTFVRLRVEQPNGQHEFQLQRTTIPIESVLGDVRSNGQWRFRLQDHPRLGYIRIINFGERTADEFRQALTSLHPQTDPLDGLILDLRYNPGGLLPAAKEVCDSLLNDGLIVTTRGRHDQLMQQFVAEPGTDLPSDVLIVVLVDRLSASASEIVAACLQDHDRAVIAGQRSWGKGTVQNVITLPGDKGALRLTVGSYHRPSGKEIHKWKNSRDEDDWGVRPDPGLEAPLTNHQNDLIVLTRRKRDLLDWDHLSPSPAAAANLPLPLGDGRREGFGPPRPSPSAVPTPIADADDQAAEAAPSLESQAIAAAHHDPAAIDPQLQKAIDHLTSEISPSPAR